ncbi:MAG: hypothetical protein ACI8S6_001035 [Myxococcota bacterium]
MNDGLSDHIFSVVSQEVAMTQLLSPEITHLAWGEIHVGASRYRDAKLFPGGSRAWDWGETGTRHVPGIQPGDVAELIDHQPVIIVFSQGVHSRLGVCPETLALLEGLGIEVAVLPTPAAAAHYTALRQQGIAVAALIHSTC